MGKSFRLMNQLMNTIEKIKFAIPNKLISVSFWDTIEIYLRIFHNYASSKKLKEGNSVLIFRDKTVSSR